MPWLAAGLIGSSVLSGVMGAISNSSAEERAQMLQEKGVQQWLNVHIPNPEEQKLVLQDFVVAGKLNPKLEKAIAQEPSAFRKIAEDHQIKQSRMRALKSLEDQGTGEATFADKAAEQGALIDQAAKSRGNQKAVLSNLASRGQMGSGLELAARLDQAQADSDNAAKTTLGLENNRRINALKSIQAAGQLAGDIGDDDYKMKSDAARAEDTISAFNTHNLRDVNAANTRAGNAADQWNLQNAQEVSNKNTAQKNFEQQYNKELRQKQFENEARVAAGVGGMYSDAAKGALEGGKNAANFWGNIASTAPKVIAAGADAFGSKNAPDNEWDDDDFEWD